MKELLFKLFRLFNDGKPSRVEASWKAQKYLHNNRVKQALVGYGMLNMSLEDIAKDMNCTRERVRQLILKGCRETHVD